MTPVGLLRHDLEWPDEQLAAGLEALGFDIVHHDVRDTTLPELSSRHVVLNRVYASVSGRDLPSVHRALELVEALEAQEVRCVNGSRASRADYDKAFAYRCMAAAGVPTPATAELTTDGDATIAAAVADLGAAVRKFAGDHGYPVVLKPNTGGRGRDVVRIDAPGEVEERLTDVLESARAIGYTGTWLVQAFVRSSRPCDCRISIIAGRFTHSHTRSLASRAGETPWIASHTLGSVYERYEPARREIEVAMAATDAIGADCNQVDVAFATEGPVIIENNPTPQFGRPFGSYAIPLLVEGMAAIIRAADGGPGAAPSRAWAAS